MAEPIFTVCGSVVQGKHLGRKLGFPTANIDAPAPEGTPRGVYAGYLAWDDQVLPCVANVGRHPTVPEGPATMEAHVPDFTGALYGKAVTLTALYYLRPEQKFRDVQALIDQMTRDVESMKERLGA